MDAVLSNIKSLDKIAEKLCYTNLKMEEIKYKWVINNANRWMGTKYDKEKSTIFYANNGVNENKGYLELRCPDDYVCFFLCNLSRSAALVTYSCYILNGENHKLTNSTTKPILIGDNQSCEIIKIHNSHLLSSPKNTLTIDCHLSYFISTESLSNTINVEPQCRLKDDIANLYLNKKNSDVTFVVGDKELPAHKLILAARSNVFSAMFEHELVENTTNRISITDADPEIIQEMLRFVYTGEVTNLEIYASGLFKVADKYALECLKVKCENALYKQITIETAAQILLLADLHKAELLKKEVMQFIKRNFWDVIRTQAWKDISGNSDIIEEISQLDVK